MIGFQTKAIAVVAIAAFTVTACTSTDPYSREEKTSHTTRGAVIGALGGAAIGALTNTSSGKQAARNALIGAGIGALAGGAVGNYMDRQETALRARLDETGVRIVRNGDNIDLILPGNITFGTDQSNVQPSFTPVLQDVALVLQEFDKSYLEVKGHTDSTGSDQYNYGLSERRAQAVADVLMREGVSPPRVIIRGAGEKEPIASNDTPAGREQNRRVELSIIPLQ